MLPAYLPNSVAAAVGGGTPVDAGRYWRDGRRILGDGKTIRGFAGGVAAGCFAGLLEIVTEMSGFIPFLPAHTFLSVFLLATGSLLGDMVKSFFKRRQGIDRGGEWPIIDQYDFLAGAFCFCLIFDPGWLFATITLPLFVAILIITPILHRGVNIIGYKIGVKKVPW
ncbi:MAG: CDP-2,3-bis-(O-geranylgeranyl)-sn-glycerol synthase [Methanospirillum sp.]|nr:CDP-2,3-bis-(O-geranylgeranyl)-sn-glycerol synthase [Methanospirillum sp.]